jgi:hypothetical protein
MEVIWKAGKLMRQAELNVLFQRRRRGPALGTTERFGESDRALYPDIERLVDAGRSLRAATIALVEIGNVEGTASARNRAERLAARYRKERALR